MVVDSIVDCVSCSDVVGSVVVSSAVVLAVVVAVVVSDELGVVIALVSLGFVSFAVFLGSSPPQATRQIAVVMNKSANKPEIAIDLFVGFFIFCTSIAGIFLSFSIAEHSPSIQ